MEARRFGFGASMSPANKFDPTDEDIVAQYLLPRAVGLPNPYEHAVIDADPCSCPPWELLRRHGHAGSDQAFFFVPPRVMSRNAGRVSRVVSPASPCGVGGVWHGQKAEDKALVIVRGDGDGDARGAPELTVMFRRYNLSYHRKGDRRSSGWVMHEYHVVHPELRPGAVVARIKITEKAKKMGKRPREQQLQEEDAVIARAGTAAALVPGLDQPGPSNYFGSESDYGHAAGNAVVASVVGEGVGDNFLQLDGNDDNFLQDEG
ncbi:NAC domain-containing protein 41 [Sorghum bicolor]|jgi:hypothetical protein|uniref:NAC domain-containing protein 41 n=1 Tax=Sorghum bicolor TaxID=4558 RepID=UPI0001A8609D|nr:NAC domain-containing protein 41 [Sorghum bicolor]|eukprot:XP_002449098.1 NAC domain-containing protein 41 [Sorghum bicolor]